MLNTDDRNFIRQVKIKEDDSEAMYLIGSQKFESIKKLQLQFDEAAQILKSAIMALRALGLLKKVDYKMLQLSNHSIRSYCEQHIKSYECEELELSTPIILNEPSKIKSRSKENKYTQSETSTLEKDFNKCFEMIGKALMVNRDNYEYMDDYLGDVGKNVHGLVTSIVATICGWYHSGKPNNEKYQNELFACLLKQTAKHLYKLANSKKNFMQNVREFEREDD